MAKPSKSHTMPSKPPSDPPIVLDPDEHPVEPGSGYAVLEPGWTAAEQEAWEDAGSPARPRPSDVTEGDPRILRHIWPTMARCRKPGCGGVGVLRGHSLKRRQLRCPACGAAIVVGPLAREVDIGAAVSVMEIRTAGGWMRQAVTR